LPNLSLLAPDRKVHHEEEKMAREPQQGDIDVTLFVPCYNEEENITATLETIAAAFQRVNRRYEVIVIDDASEDCSVEKVRKFHSTHPEMPVRLVVNPTNRGLASNFQEAARIGCGRFIRIVCGDNVEPVETQTAILQCLDQADMVVPYPLHVHNKSLFRLFLSRTYTRIINLLSGFRLRYWNGCALLRREDVAHYFPSTRGFGFQAALVSKLLCLGRTYVEVGCRYVERRSGTSKACTLKNFRSVTHVALRIVGRRLRGWGRSLRRLFGGVARGSQQIPVTATQSGSDTEENREKTFGDSGKVNSAA